MPLKLLNVMMNSLSEPLKVMMLKPLYKKVKKPLMDVKLNKSEPKKILPSPKNNLNKKMLNSSMSTPPEKEKNMLSIPSSENSNS